MLDVSLESGVASVKEVDCSVSSVSNDVGSVIVVSIEINVVLADELSVDGFVLVK